MGTRAAGLQPVSPRNSKGGATFSGALASPTGVDDPLQRALSRRRSARWSGLCRVRAYFQISKEHASVAARCGLKECHVGSILQPFALQLRRTLQSSRQSPNSLSTHRHASAKARFGNADRDQTLDWVDITAQRFIASLRPATKACDSSNYPVGRDNVVRCAHRRGSRWLRVSRQFCLARRRC